MLDASIVAKFRTLITTKATPSEFRIFLSLLIGETAQYANHAEDATRVALNELLKKGLVEHPKRGHWRVAGVAGAGQGQGSGQVKAKADPPAPAAQLPVPAADAPAEKPVLASAALKPEAPKNNLPPPVNPAPLAASTPVKPVPVQVQVQKLPEKPAPAPEPRKKNLAHPFLGRIPGQRAAALHQWAAAGVDQDKLRLALTVSHNPPPDDRGPFNEGDARVAALDLAERFAVRLFGPQQSS